jgi:excisionase family DNA binding protein
MSFSKPFQPLLRPSDVAELFRVSRPTVYSWVAQGRLSAIRLNGRLRFRPESLTTLLKISNNPGSVT